MNILIIEDTKSLAKTLADIIQKENYSADIALDGYSGLEYARGSHYDAIVLDIMLPDIDGFKVLSTIRKEKNKTPILILTARSDLKDRIYGLDIGADYYLTKPFEREEFLACLRAIIRRQSPMIIDDLQFGDIILSTSLHELKCNSKSIKLNSKEYELLRLLIINQNQVLSKDIILNKIWGFNSDATYNNLEAYISFLRRKLALLSSKVTICIVRKVGYYLEVGHD